MATLPIEQGLSWIGYIVFLIACFVAGRMIGKWHNKRAAAKRAAKNEYESELEKEDVVV